MYRLIMNVVKEDMLQEFQELFHNNQMLKDNYLLNDNVEPRL